MLLWIDCFRTMTQVQLPTGISALYDAINSDVALKDRLISAGDADEFLSIANEAGFELSETDIAYLQEVAVAESDRELSDEELAGVAGGSWTKKKVFGIKGKASETAADVLTGVLMATTVASIFVK